MASIPMKDASGTTVYVETDVAGTSAGSPARFLQGIDAQAALDGAAPSKAILVAGKNGSGNLKPIAIDGSGNALVAIAGTPTVAFASPPAVTISGTPSVGISGTVSLGAAIPAGGNVIGSTKDAGSAYSEDRKVFTVADASTGGPHYICDAPTAGQKRVVVDMIVSGAADLVYTIKEETSGTTLLQFSLAAKTPFQLTTRGLFKVPTADKRIYVETSGAGAIYITTLTRSEA